jgi:hypothetical protein
MADDTWKLSFATQNHQQASAGASPDSPLMCQLPSSPTFKIDSQPQHALSHRFCLKLLNLTSNTDYTLKYPYLLLKFSNIGGPLADGTN